MSKVTDYAALSGIYALSVSVIRELKIIMVFQRGPLMLLFENTLFIMATF